MKASKKEIRISVVYALPHKQIVIPLRVAENTRLMDAIRASGIAEKVPEVDLENLAVGIFGRTVSDRENCLLQDNDRIEFYRPLIQTPEQLRRARMALQAEKTGKD